MTSEKTYTVEAVVNSRISGGWDPVAGAPTLEDWHSLGSLSGFTVTYGRYKMSSFDNMLIVDIEVTGGGANANSVNFNNTLPTAYRPANNRHYPLAKTSNVGNSTDQWPRVLIDTAGAVTVLTVSNNTLVFGATIYMPLD